MATDSFQAGVEDAKVTLARAGRFYTLRNGLSQKYWADIPERVQATAFSEICEQLEMSFDQVGRALAVMASPKHLQPKVAAAIGVTFVAPIE